MIEVDSPEFGPHSGFTIYHLLTSREVCSVLEKYQTGVFMSAQKHRSDISLLQTEQARSINSLFYGFTEI